MKDWEISNKSIIIILVLFLFFLACGAKIGNDRGYSLGYTHGHANGIGEGFYQGNKQCQDFAIQAGVARWYVSSQKCPALEFVWNYDLLELKEKHLEEYKEIVREHEELWGGPK